MKTEFLIKNFIQDLRTELLFDDLTLGDCLGASQAELQHISDTGNLTYKQISSLSEYLNISIENILTENIDFNTIRKNFISPSSALPERYLEAGGTYMSVIRNKINFVEEKFNSKVADNLLSELQLTRQALLNDNLLVNIEFGNKILNLLENQYNFSSADFSMMAIKGSCEGARKKLIEKHGHLTAHSDVAEVIADNGEKFERNYHYCFERINEEVFVIKTVGREEVHEKLKSSVLINKPTINFKKAVLESFSLLLDLGKMNVFHVEEQIINLRHHVNFYVTENHLGRLH